MSHHKCPVCKMDVGDSKTGIIYKGKEYKLCCEGCKRQFEDNPEKYT